MRFNLDIGQTDILVDHSCIICKCRTLFKKLYFIALVNCVVVWWKKILQSLIARFYWEA